MPVLKLNLHIPSIVQIVSENLQKVVDFCIFRFKNADLNKTIVINNETIFIYTTLIIVLIILISLVSCIHFIECIIHILRGIRNLTPQPDGLDLVAHVRVVASKIVGPCHFREVPDDVFNKFKDLYLVSVRVWQPALVDQTLHNPKEVLDRIKSR